MLALKDDLTLYHGSYASIECLTFEGSEPMGFDEEAVTDEQREACAVVVMRTMLEDWCDDTGVPFDDALDAFASSRTYELLFDFSSRQWAEGPDNLRFVWEQEPEERLADLLGLARGLSRRDGWSTMAISPITS